MDYGLPDARAFLGEEIPGQSALLWERMTVHADREKAYKTDLVLRRALARRFREDVDTVMAAKPFVDSFLALKFEHVVSFNFDNVLLPKGVRPERKKGPATWATLAAEVGSTTIWYPHGHASDPRSIVLGSHAYGARIGVFQRAFDRQAMLAKKNFRGVANVVSVFMTRPLLFLGLSLTREEWTLWWLLAQRARFLKRKKPIPAFAVVPRPHADDLGAVAAFDSLQRAAEVVGLSLLVVPNHEEGWLRLREALRWKVEPQTGVPG